MKNHFKCIGIVGHPRHPTALTTHEMLWRWLCSKGYEVLVEQQIAHELQLSNVKTGTLAEMVEGIELTLKSMLDVVRKFGVEVIADTNVPLDPNVHQAIAMVESEDVAAGNVLSVMQKGYTLNGRTIRAAMVTVAKAK